MNSSENILFPEQCSTKNTSALVNGNQAIRNKDFEAAIAFYVQALVSRPNFAEIISTNLSIAWKRYRKVRESIERKRVAICGWALSHQVTANRVYTLAQLYETFAEVEIIGSFFPSHGREIAESICNTTIPQHTFLIEDTSRFIDQAIALVIAHPYDIVHLSQACAPNIFLGIFYKLIWGAQVILDIDDTALDVVNDVPHNLPALKDLDGDEWTQIAVNLANAFDGITTRADSENSQRLRQRLDQCANQPLSASAELFAQAVDHTVLTTLLQIPNAKSALVPRNISNATLLIQKIAVVVHVYYPEIWPEIAQYLKAITYPFDLFITTTTDQSATVEPIVTADFPNARIKVQPNGGMDVLPFLALVPTLIDEAYLTVCKLHTKRGDGEQGTLWRRILLEALVGDDASFTEVIHAFTRHPELQLAGPASLYLSARKLMYDNESNIRHLFQHIEDRPVPLEDWGFFSGTMFWVRPTALQKLANGLAHLEIEHPVKYQQDGQMVHAIERLFGLLPGLNQGKVGLLHPAESSFSRRFVLQIVPANTRIGQAEIHEIMSQYAMHWKITEQHSGQTNLNTRTLNIFDWQLHYDSLPSSYNRNFSGVIGVFIHLHYEDLATEIAQYLSNIKYKFDVYISTTDSIKQLIIEKAFTKYYMNIKIKILRNTGRDIAPFLLGFSEEIKNYEICLRLHSKKSTHNKDNFGSIWRKYLFNQLLGDSKQIDIAMNLFNHNPKLGILIPHHWNKIKDWIGIGNNWQPMQFLLNKINISIDPNQAIEYPTGSMFWFRSESLRLFFDLGLTWNDFQDSSEDHRDASLAHGIERVFLFFVAQAGYQWSFIEKFRDIYDNLDFSQKYQLLQDNPEFNKDYYLTQNHDIARDRIDPILHFLQYGWKEGRNPSEHFNIKFYQKIVQRISGWEGNPLIHYLIEGKKKHLPINPSQKRHAIIKVEDLYSAYHRCEENPDYVAETFPLIKKTDIKLIAFYFPQFHPFAENDKFWGRGFTEWTNTTKTLPMFKGHYQPRLPGELGFYDTRIKQVLQRQIELAKQFGIYGFCFHHYFFDGKPVMRAPYNLILENKDLDIPFCLHWANEPWTVRWDGLASKSGMLLDQRHFPEDDLLFFKDIEQAITDQRYIKIDGRPLLIIYRPQLFPNMRETIDRWNNCCRQIGLDGFYLAVMQTPFEGKVNPKKYGFDAAIEYPPHNLDLSDISSSVELYDPYFSGTIKDYREAAKKSIEREKPEYTLFRGITTDWDCTPRRSDPDIFINSTPEQYQNWLEEICCYSEKHLISNQRFIFINAWNEWAEGAYLEPDRKYGYSYLHATARALNNYVAFDSRKIQNAEVVIGAHIFYLDLLDEFLCYFSNIPIPFDLFVTTTSSETSKIKDFISEKLGNKVKKVIVVDVPNIGRDGAPFLLHFLPYSQNYEISCWVHSKKSPYEPKYQKWRNYLLGNLLGNTGDIASIIETFLDNSNIGVVYPKPFIHVADKVEWGSNFDTIDLLLSQIGIKIDKMDTPIFPAGGMFWFRPRALNKFLTLGIKLENFIQLGSGPQDINTGLIVDGTLSHAIERMILYISKNAGYQSLEFSYYDIS